MIYVHRWHDFILRNPKCSTKWYQSLILNTFQKIVRYKINLWKSVAFLYTNDEKSEEEIKKIISFKIALKRLVHC